MAILQDQTNTHTDIMAELARLREENAKLKAGRSPGLSFKVSDKGAVSVYGMGRFPVTLYREQWAKLFEAQDRLAAFIEANANLLSTKS